MRKTAVVIQARTGSKRFPGKVMADLGGKPMLKFMLDRLRPLEDECDLWVATTTEPEDDVISDALCHNEVIRCYRGSKLDVLSRFKAIAIAGDYETIVRLTGDCPFVWAGLVKHVLKFHEGHRYTACLKVDGFEVQVYDRKLIEMMDAALPASCYEREHVAPPINIRRNMVSFPSLSVDTCEDLERVRDFVG